MATGPRLPLKTLRRLGQFGWRHLSSDAHKSLKDRGAGLTAAAAERRGNR